MPVDAGLVVPLAPLSNLATHKEQLLSRLSVHISKEETQVGKFLPVISRHLPYQGALSMNHLIVRERQHEIFIEGIDHTECKITVMEAPVNRIECHIAQRVIHPAH